MKKKVEKKINPYTAFKSQDANLLNKLDDKIAYFGKQNKKYATEFYANAKNFVLNAIEVKKNSNGVESKLPKPFMNIINDRDIDKLFNNFQNDTRAVAKELFTEEMAIEEIVAVAIEYVRISSSNFERYESETPQSSLSELAQKFAKSYNGVLSFYYGLADDVDRAQLMSRLINLGIDIKHSIAYAECIVDAYGIPITQIIEFKGKPAIAISAYSGVVKNYNKNISTMSSMYQFMDFSEYLPQAKTRALKAFRKFHNCKDVLPKVPSLEQACEKLAVSSYDAMSLLTATQANLLVNVNNRVVKFSTLCEIICLDRNIEYELIPDLFVPNLATIKVLIENGRFKIFPNKVLDEEMKLADKRNYILNKGAENSSSNDSLADSLDSVNRDAQAEFGKNEKNADNIEPLPASQVLENLQVRFKPQEVSDFLLDGARFNLTESQLKNSMTVDLSDLGELKSVDLDKAEQERLELENSLGISQSQEKVEPVKQTSKKKTFFDMLNEIEEKVQNSKAKKLQERFEEYQQNGELQSNINASIDESQIQDIEDKNSTIPIENEDKAVKIDSVTVKNDNISKIESTGAQQRKIDDKNVNEKEDTSDEKLINMLNIFDDYNDEDDDLTDEEWEAKYSINFDDDEVVDENLNKQDDEIEDNKNLNQPNIEPINNAETNNIESYNQEKVIEDNKSDLIKENEELLRDYEKLKRENEQLKGSSEQLKSENKKIKEENEKLLQEQAKIELAKEEMERVNLNHFHDETTNLSASAPRTDGIAQDVPVSSSPENYAEKQLQESFLPNINKVSQNNESVEKTQKPFKGQVPLKASSFVPSLPPRKNNNVPKLPKRKS